MNSYIYELNNQISSLVQQNCVLISKLNDDSLISNETGKNSFKNLSTNKKKGENPSSVSDTNNMIKKRKLNDNEDKNTSENEADEVIFINETISEKNEIQNQLQTASNLKMTQTNGATFASKLNQKKIQIGK